MRDDALMVDVYRCRCGSEWEEETPTSCPDCGRDQFTNLGLQPTQLAQDPTPTYEREEK